MWVRKSMFVMLTGHNPKNSPGGQFHLNSKRKKCFQVKLIQPTLLWNNLSNPNQLTFSLNMKLSLIPFACLPKLSLKYACLSFLYMRRPLNLGTPHCNHWRQIDLPKRSHLNLETLFKMKKLTTIASLNLWLDIYVDATLPSPYSTYTPKYLELVNIRVFLLTPSGLP